MNERYSDIAFNYQTWSWMDLFMVAYEIKTKKCKRKTPIKHGFKPRTSELLSYHYFYPDL